MKKYIAMLLTVLVAALPTFAQTTDDHAKAKKGAVIGGVAGAIAGAVIGNNRGHHSSKRGAVVGGIAGTAAGAIVGAMMDKQERELRQIQGVDVTRTAPDEVRVTVKNEVLFDFNSSELRSASRASLRDMSDVFQKYPDTTLYVEGHTDSIGSASYNKRLSLRRADSVANYLEELGVKGGRVNTYGFGKSQPRATNSTAAGRQLNRRVEIHVRANAS
ncbi:MAG TPA: OmpA family protein [Thermoanaerobaculia bacterium]|nr:OmpA family protein [Thermoanaerobaculia bacterium]